MEANESSEGSLRVVFVRLAGVRHFWRFSLDVAFSSKLSCKASPVTTPAAPAKEAKVDVACVLVGETLLARLYPDLQWLQDQKQQQRLRVLFLKMCSRSKQSDRSDKFDRCQDEQAS